jgi:ATP-dependent Clp protease ATP-binding subunit ClpA
VEVPAVYERFTERARKVMQLANQEAQRFNHHYIGTEHILLGLAREGLLAQGCVGVAATVLHHFDIDLRKVRREVEKIVCFGPDVHPGTRLLQTPRAKKVIEYAIEEARVLGRAAVGTGALLLGLLREEEGVACQVLLNLGLELKAVRREVQRLLGGGPGSPADEGQPPWAAVHELPTEELPAELAASLKVLDAQIDSLNRQKEGAVAGQDFEQAAHLRDQADRLSRQRRTLILEWRDRHQPDSSWLAGRGTVVQIARAIYAERRWQDLPVLADALEEAGCADREILDHCRRPGEHGRGCWVIDLFLGEGVK